MSNSSLQVGDRVRVAYKLEDVEADRSFEGCEGEISNKSDEPPPLYTVRRDSDGREDAFYARELTRLR